MLEQEQSGTFSSRKQCAPEEPKNEYCKFSLLQDCLSYWKLDGLARDIRLQREDKESNAFS